MKWFLLLALVAVAIADRPLVAQVRILRWHTTLESAQQAARDSGKPLFIVFRCVPCAGCREWDALVAQKDGAISALREQFVCARIPQMNGVDIARFEHDFDNTWAGYFTDAELNIYSRYGGRDETGHESRMSKDSLLTTMREVLEAHTQRETTAKGDLFHPTPKQPTTPDDIPLVAQHHSGCIHCHEVQEYRIRQAFVDGTFTRKMLFGHPLPENLGLLIDRAHGHKAERVQADSPAARAGVQSGDVVVRISDVPIRSEQDIRWALHRADDTGTVAMTVARTSGVRSETLRFDVPVSGDWKQTELGWRKSLRSVPLSLGFLGYPLEGNDLRALGLSEPHLALRVISIRGAGVATALGLQMDDVIVECDGRASRRTLDEFKSDLLRRHDPGSEVTVKVRRAGKTIELKAPLPDWALDLSSLP
jgi:hypothetical protein